MKGYRFIVSPTNFRLYLGKGLNAKPKIFGTKKQIEHNYSLTPFSYNTSKREGSEMHLNFSSVSPDEFFFSNISLKFPRFFFNFRYFSSVISSSSFKLSLIFYTFLFSFFQTFSTSTRNFS